jgi:hypothetical protein
MDKELEEFGCLPKNCIQDTWVPETMITVGKKTLSNNPFYEHYLVENRTTIWFSTIQIRLVISNFKSLNLSYNNSKRKLV